MTPDTQSWGRYPRAVPAIVRRLTDRAASLPESNLKRLVYGNGRSYGDACLNDGGEVLLARGLDRFIEFDPHAGVLRAEAGVLLSEVLDLVVPHRWFPPVTPGTRYLTLGGAVANDVHGKNHHRAGAFGCHLRALELVRSDGERRVCTPSENADWLAATVGGLGLTGLITWVEIQLQRIPSPWLAVQERKFSSIDGFFELAAESDETHEFTVAWLDCAATGPKLGRGIFTRGNFEQEPPTRDGPKASRVSLSLPLVPPFSVVNGPAIRAFNAVYARRSARDYRAHYLPFFYPLDGIRHWNRMYGPRGFLQYQCVLPSGDMLSATRELLRHVASSGQGSFLSVIKMFGARESPGLLSFPRPGVTIALDFPFRQDRTLRLLDDLDTLVKAAGGAVYPAKDARMSREMFRHSFPQLDKFLQYVDPGFCSGLARRVMDAA